MSASFGTFHQSVEVERVGVSLEWQKELKVVFRS